jgi:NADH:ubiquinone oxidoreductase subunit 4 (subunit M)
LTSGLAENPISTGPQTVILLLLVGGFAAKSAVFPLHGWLPEALAEAPAGTGVILAGGVLKIGGYGLARFALVLLPDAVAACSVWLSWLFAAGMIFAAGMAMVQSDLRRLLGYACAGQMGFCMLGLLSTNPPAVQGGVLQMIGSGLAVGGLLSLLGIPAWFKRGAGTVAGTAGHRPKVGRVLRTTVPDPFLNPSVDSERIGILRIQRGRRPMLTALVLLLAAANAGMPGTAGFIGTRSILSNLPGQSGAILVLTGLGVALGVCYTLKLAWRMIAWRGELGLPDQSHQRTAGDGSWNGQIPAACLLSVFILWIGLAPDFFTSRLHSIHAGPMSPQSPASDDHTASGQGVRRPSEAVDRQPLLTASEGRHTAPRISAGRSITTNY